MTHSPSLLFLQLCFEYNPPTPPTPGGNLSQKKIWWANKPSDIWLDCSLLSGAQKQSRVASSPRDVEGRWSIKIANECHAAALPTPAQGCVRTAYSLAAQLFQALLFAVCLQVSTSCSLRVRARTWAAPWGSSPACSNTDFPKQGSYSGL